MNIKYVYVYFLIWFGFFLREDKLFIFCLANFGLITNTILLMVSEVFAMLVDIIIFFFIASLVLVVGVGLKIRCCRLGGRVEYSGIYFMFFIFGFRLLIFFCSFLYVLLIFCWILILNIKFKFAKYYKFNMLKCV